MTEVEQWIEEFEALKDQGVAAWNRNVIPWMKERGDDYKRLAHHKATKQLGYTFDKSKMLYVAPWKMYACRGVNLIAVGWQDGILRCIFASSKEKRIYRYGSADKPVPQAEFEKLRNSPYPDRLHQTNIKQKGYFVEREGITLALEEEKTA